MMLPPGKEPVNPDKPNKYPQASWYHKPNDEYREDWDIEGAITRNSSSTATRAGMRCNHCQRGRWRHFGLIIHSNHCQKHL